jgi:feruloyl esterase
LKGWFWFFFDIFFCFPFLSFGHNLLEIADFGTNPGNLKMYVYSPENLPKNSGVPLVVVLHGCFQNAEAVSETSGWNKLADLNGFVVVYPQQNYTNNASGCFDWFRSKDVNRGRGEVFSIKQMIDYMPNNFGTDSHRVFVSGLSAGAAMAVALMATYPESIKAGAIYAGGPYKVARNAFEAMFVLWLPPNKSPKKWAQRVRSQNPNYKGSYPALIVVHGNRDFVVNIRNSRELIQQWAYLHNVALKSVKIQKEFAGCSKVSRLTYKNQSEKDVIVFYKIKELGHALPIKIGEAENEGGLNDLFSSNIGFHSTYWVAKDFGILK